MTVPNHRLLVTTLVIAMAVTLDPQSLTAQDERQPGVRRATEARLAVLQQQLQALRQHLAAAEQQFQSEQAVLQMESQVQQAQRQQAVAQAQRIARSTAEQQERRGDRRPHDDHPHQPESDRRPTRPAPDRPDHEWDHERPAADRREQAHQPGRDHSRHGDPHRQDVHHAGPHRPDQPAHDHEHHAHPQHDPHVAHRDHPEHHPHAVHPALDEHPHHEHEGDARVRELHERLETLNRAADSVAQAGLDDMSRELRHRADALRQELEHHVHRAEGEVHRAVGHEGPPPEVREMFELVHGLHNEVRELHRKTDRILELLEHRLPQRPPQLRRIERPEMRDDASGRFRQRFGFGPGFSFRERDDREESGDDRREERREVTVEVRRVDGDEHGEEAAEEPEREHEERERIEIRERSERSERDRASQERRRERRDDD